MEVTDFDVLHRRKVWVGKGREPGPGPKKQFDKICLSFQCLAVWAETGLGQGSLFVLAFLPLCCFYEHFLLA